MQNLLAHVSKNYAIKSLDTVASTGPTRKSKVIYS